MGRIKQVLSVLVGLVYSAQIGKYGDSTKIDFKEIQFEVVDWIYLPRGRFQLWILVHFFL